MKKHWDRDPLPHLQAPQAIHILSCSFLANPACDDQRETERSPARDQQRHASWTEIGGGAAWTPTSGPPGSRGAVTSSGDGAVLRHLGGPHDSGGRKATMGNCPDLRPEWYCRSRSRGKGRKRASSIIWNRGWAARFDKQCNRDKRTTGVPNKRVLHNLFGWFVSLILLKI